MSARPLSGRTEHFFGFSLGWRTMMVGGCVMVVVAASAPLAFSARSALNASGSAANCPRCRGPYNYKGQPSDNRGDQHARGTQILLDVKLRTAGRQFDEQASGHVQASDQGHETDPERRRVF